MFNLKSHYTDIVVLAGDLYYLGLGGNLPFIVLLRSRYSWSQSHFPYARLICFELPAVLDLDELTRLRSASRCDGLFGDESVGVPSLL